MRLILLLFVLPACLSGCTTAPDVSTLSFTALDYGYDGPETAREGWARIVMQNGGQDLHHMTLLKLSDGRSAQDLVAHLLDQHAVPDWATTAGGPNAFEPGQGGEATVRLEAGRYAIACFIPNREGIPHFALGMITELMVESRSARPAEPDVEPEFGLREFSFDVPELSPGQHHFRVNNLGAQDHELTLVELHGDATIPDILAAFSPNATGPPPGTFVGGTTSMAAGHVNYFMAELKAGRYALICFVEDPETGAPHFALGMGREITV